MKTVNTILFIVEEIGLYLQYARRLGFEENPNYEYLKELFDKVLESIGEIDDGVYDWMLLNDGKGWEVRTKRLSFLNAN
jgi:casein kinase 1